MLTCGQCRASVAPEASCCWSCGVTLCGPEHQTLPGPGASDRQAADDAMVGRSVIDQYVIRAKIGEGGMGAVYLADQPSVGRAAVIKVLHPWLSKDPAVAARFATEARAAARLQNPHIVAIYNYGAMTDGTLFIAMEHLQGMTLAEAIRREGRLEPARAVGIATQCCQALAEAHRHGVIHRDLKPSNIMLVSRGGPDFVKVLDFGIAKIDGADSTRNAELLGTLRSMAPEQLQGGVVDARTDVYALGLIVYEMLAGRPAFHAPTPAGYVHAHLHQQPPSLRLSAPEVRITPALEAAVLRAIHKSPYARPRSADAFAEELWTALMATVDVSHLPMPEPRAPTPRASGIWLGTLLGTGLGLLGVGAGAWLAFAQDERAAATEAPEPPAEVTPPAPRSVPRGITELGPPTPETAALMAKSVPELEAELQRVTILSAMPRQSIEMSLQAYREAVSRPPPGTDPTWYRKALLADLIVAWRAVPATQTPADRSLDELEAVFLTMESSLPLETRRQMLHRLKNSAAGNPDPDWAVTVVLHDWIADHGSNSKAEPEIEILDE